MKLDGRPMSGDIGRGATRETIAFAAQLALSNDRPPGSHMDPIPGSLYSRHFTNELLVSLQASFNWLVAQIFTLLMV